MADVGLVGMDVESLTGRKNLPSCILTFMPWPAFGLIRRVSISRTRWEIHGATHLCVWTASPAKKILSFAENCVPTRWPIW